MKLTYIGNWNECKCYLIGTKTLIIQGGINKPLLGGNAVDKPWNNDIALMEHVIIKGKVTFDEEHSNLSGLFEWYHNLRTITGLNNFDTTNVTDMSLMFNECYQLYQLDVSNFNTSNVTNMSSMFNECYNLEELDLIKWNVLSVTNMSWMFSHCYRLTSLNLTEWNTTNVTDMSHMFEHCKQLTKLDVNHFNTSNVTNMNCMFYNCGVSSFEPVSLKLTELDLIKSQSKWNTSKVESMNDMFGYCSNLTKLDLSNLDGWNVRDMSEMFIDCCNLTQLDLSNFGFNHKFGTNCYHMLSGCTKLESIILPSGIKPYKVREILKSL